MALLEWVSIAIPSLNALSAVLLVTAFVAIRSGKRERHRNLMLTNLGVSILFSRLLRVPGIDRGP